MTPIGIGTLCLLVEPHELAGIACITTSAERWNDGLIDARTFDLMEPCRVYAIAPTRVPALYADLPPDGWCAKRAELIPLTPPSAPRVVITRKRIPEATLR